MELGHFSIQAFVSLLILVAGACLALVCDFLKRNNEELRQLNVELTVRREEEQKRSQVLTPRAAPELEKTPAASHLASPKEHSNVGKEYCEKKRTANAEALAAMQRGASLAGTGKKPRSTPAPVAKESKPEPKPEVVVGAQTQVVQGLAKKDWGSMLSRNAQGIKSLPKTPTTLGGSLPEGFQDGYVLRKLVESRQPVTGLVVSIGVNGGANSSVLGLVQSLIGPNDFAAQNREDEFLLIYPQEHGASAHRKLNQIAEKLWDFQLSSPGSLQILFSWGGVEVRSESIEEAIASASERMQETQRGRKLLTMSAPAPANDARLRQAV